MLIYIAEDNEFFAQAISVGLAQYGYKIKAFQCGEHMLKEIKNNKPDVILLDYHFEISDKKCLNGDQILNILQANHKEIPVIMLTSNDEINESVELLKNGAIDYILKNDYFLDNITNTLKNIEHIMTLNKSISQHKQKIRQFKKRLVLSGFFFAIAFVILYFIYF